MTRSSAELRQLIKATIDRILAAGQPVTKSWSIQAVRRHIVRPDGEQSWYWLECESIAIDALVGAYIRELRNVEIESEPSDAQMIIPGYERLQRFYSVVRAGEQTLVPIDQLLSFEVEQKKAEFRRNIAGLSTHLDEFTRYHEQRGVGE
jgi:hypothetical protein